jgi:ribosomal-protein-alanine N-acetyltransferase
MNATTEAAFETLTPARIAEVVAIERTAYSHPWTERNFADSLQAGYNCQLLIAGHTLLGYFVAMRGVDEVHLLNITVAPTYQRQGWASVLIQGLAIWSRGQGTQCLWLEVRAGNQQALAVYEHLGFVRVGRRKDYYPADGGKREDAVVMSKTL